MRIRVMQSIGNLWAELEVAPAGAHGWRARRLNPGAACILYAAIEEPGAAPAVLLQVGAAALSHVVEFPEVAGFSVRPQPISTGPHGQVRLCMVLVDPRKRDLFELVAEDVVSAVSAATDERSAVAALLSRIALWQRFFRRDNESLSVEEQIGLIGELHVLEHLVLPALGPLAGMAAWKGPLDGLRDFKIVPGFEVEVKTTTELGGCFRVANLAQLDDDGIAHLLLCVVTIPLDPGGVSLPEIVEHLREMFGGMDRAAADSFEDTLLQAGYHELHAERYRRMKVRFQSRRLYRVGEGFPRIVRSGVASGVREAVYTVAVGNCLPFLVDEGTGLVQWMGDVHGGQ